MKRKPRRGDHIQQRGDVWHYWRIIPADCKSAYGKSVESRSLNTIDRDEAKGLAKAIDVEVEKRIRETRAARSPEIIAERIADRVRLRAALRRNNPLSGDPIIYAARHIQREIDDAPLTDEDRAKTADLAWRKIDQALTSSALAAKLGEEIASMLERSTLEQINLCRRSILSLIRDQVGTDADPAAA
jgi:hypothetical protein